jgi:hypothetical protein
MNIDERKDNQNRSEDKPALKPDPETLHTTDPQENMEGPVSSTMHGLSEAFKTSETKEEADEERDRKL